MPRIEWDDSLSVQNERIDEQHRGLFDSINKLSDAVDAGVGAAAIDETIEELSKYASFHFATEESLMAAHHYPELEPHRMQHHEFMSKVGIFRKKLEGGDKSVPEEVSEYLAEWYLVHVRMTDQKYAPFLASKGLK